MRYFLQIVLIVKTHRLIHRYRIIIANLQIELNFPICCIAFYLCLYIKGSRVELIFDMAWKFAACNEQSGNPILTRKYHWHSSYLYIGVTRRKCNLSLAFRLVEQILKFSLRSICVLTLIYSFLKSFIEYLILNFLLDYWKKIFLRDG